MLRRLLSRRPSAFSRTQVWREVGLGAEIDRREAHRAQRVVVLAVVAISAVLFAFSERKELFPGYGTEVRVATVVLLVVLGWSLASALWRATSPALYRRLDPGAAGTLGFLVRLVILLGMIVVALRIAGIKPQTLAVGGAFTAVVFGLAAQQVLGNLLAGVVLISNRPFRVGERIRVKAGAFAGELDGIVSSLGLFYTTLVSGADRIMLPNSVLLQSAIIPLREPERVELRARFGAETTPREVQGLLEDEISVPLRYPPHIAVVEFDRDDVVVKIVSTPENPADGATLAEEVLAGVRQANGRDGARGGGGAHGDGAAADARSRIGPWPSR